MSGAAQGTGGAGGGTGAVGGSQVAVLLACFSGTKAAGKARHGLDAQLKSHGDALLDSVILQVDAKHKASDHDPHRVLYAALTPALTWGLFGLLFGSDAVVSAIIWAVIGAICGGLYGYYMLRLAPKRELARIGAQLPAPSSALALFVETTDARRVLEATAGHQPTAASVAAISADLATRVFAGPAEAIELPGGGPGRELPPDHDSVLSMIMLRYPDPGTAKKIAAEMAPKTKKAAPPLQVELVIQADRSGHRHVTDPTLGVAATSRQSLVSWGGFGVVFGALAGAIDGGGFGGALKGALVTAVIWGIFGLIAGALFGLWAGRAVSARRLKSVGPLLAPGTSMVVAWAAEPVTDDTLDRYLTPGSQRLVLRFDPVEGGALLEAA
jgi:uncharacterized membrane protein